MVKFIYKDMKMKKKCCFFPCFSFFLSITAGKNEFNKHRTAHSETLCDVVMFPSPKTDAFL